MVSSLFQLALCLLLCGQLYAIALSPSEFPTSHINKAEKKTILISVYDIDLFNENCICNLLRNTRRLAWIRKVGHSVWCYVTEHSQNEKYLLISLELSLTVYEWKDEKDFLNSSKQRALIPLKNKTVLFVFIEPFDRTTYILRSKISVCIVRFAAFILFNSKFFMFPQKQFTNR